MYINRCRCYVYYTYMYKYITKLCCLFIHRPSLDVSKLIVTLNCIFISLRRMVITHLYYIADLSALLFVRQFKVKF